MGSRRSTISLKNMTVINFVQSRVSYEHGFVKKCDGHKHRLKSRAKLSFDRFFVHHQENFEIQDIPNILARGKSYEHDFMKNATITNFTQSLHGFVKKIDGHKLYAKSCEKSCTKSSFSIFRAPSRIFKIPAIPNVLAHGKLYEHGFAKKYDGHKFYAKSGFDRFFVHHLKILKY
ncbi:hypothetical protein BHM03_00038299 [Ensete ventricosum]|nr:hypothetical protein BHM03_00038299 [Ensete ventricosum]